MSGDISVLRYHTLSVLRGLPVVLILSALGVSSSWAVDKSRLWLPSSHKKLMPQLIRAAELAESSGPCVRVISGKLLHYRSPREGAEFLLICRNREGRSFNVTLNTLDLQAGGRSSLADSLPTQPAVSKKVPKEQDSPRKLCMDAFLKRTRNMIDLRFEGSEISEVVSEASGVTRIRIPFRAQNLHGRELSYLADCEVGSDGVPTVAVIARGGGK